jgi:serine/threonine protein kinase
VIHRDIKVCRAHGTHVLDAPSCVVAAPAPPAHQSHYIGASTIQQASNILISKSSSASFENWRVCVCDFGVSVRCSSGSELSAFGAIGTPGLFGRSVVVLGGGCHRQCGYSHWPWV